VRAVPGRRDTTVGALTVNRRLLGATGLEVSILGLGTVKFGRTEALKYQAPFTLPDDRTLRDLLDAARGAGINLLDTAPAYGRSEERLGALLAGRRAEWIICTKAGEEFDDGRSHFDFSPMHVRRSVERSLRRLRTDYLDIVLLHSNGDDDWILRDSGALETLMDLKQAGAIRAIGISHKSVAGGELAIARCDVVMATLNPEYREEVGLIARARTRGVGVLIKKAFSSGHAGDPDARRRSLELCIGTPGVSSIVIGTIDPRHLAENVQLAGAAAPSAPFGPGQPGR
jgi:aryl-alcohol dehydrogenase-like predicted oxidoreductase